MECKRFLLATGLALAASISFAGWEKGSQFKMGTVAGRACIVAPDGTPFKSVGMVWAYGPEEGQGPLTVARLTNTLQRIKDLGFNTLNLYGDQFIPEMLDWCDRNELAVYFRTSYYHVEGFPGALGEHPDYMDPQQRKAAKDSYRKFLGQIKDHPSVLAIDMDHRWLFPLDWSGEKRFDEPMVRKSGVAYFPQWLRSRYGSIEKLNAAWGTKYASFDAILADKTLFSEGAFRKLGGHPARVDVVQYTLWTAEDFLKELAAFLRSQVPGVLVTPTTEHPECIPDVNPPPSTGIAFLSPVHYNGLADFDRDPAGLCKLIYETRWHYDMQGAPAYVSETGFRTTTLKQEPPVTTYAWAVPPTEENAARLYAVQFSLMNVLPWISGYGFFKMYDKIPEGDFGYLRDNGEKKPLARVGDAINTAFDTAALADPAPEVWIYYPDYALATRRPAFQQIKTFVAAFEKPFLDALAGQITKSWDALLSGDRDAGSRFARAVTKDFERHWRGFAFTRTLKNDGKPVVLLSTISEILSPADRAALMKKRTVAFGAVGIRGPAMQDTPPWSLASIGLGGDAARERFAQLRLADGSLQPVGMPASPTGSVWNQISASPFEAGVPCDAQGIDVLPGRYTRVEFLLASEDGDAAPFCDFVYGDGSWSRKAFAPTVSDVRFPAFMTEGVKWDDRNLSVIRIPLAAAKELVRIELPAAPWVTIHGVVLVSGGAALDADVAVRMERETMTGQTAWWLQIPPDRAGPGKVLEEFETGEPAVIAAGSHVTYLYDPLNWAGKTNEISRNVEGIAQSLAGSLKYLNGVKIDE